MYTCIVVGEIWEGGCYGYKSPCVREFDGIVCIARFNLVGFYMGIMDFLFFIFYYMVEFLWGLYVTCGGLVGCVCILWM